MMGISQRTWSAYETGQPKPKLHFLIALESKGFKVPDLSAGIIHGDVDTEEEIIEEEVVPTQEIEGSQPDNAGTDTDDVSKAEKKHWRQVQKTTKGRPVPLYTQDDFADGSGYEVPILNQKLSAGNGSELPDNDVADAFVRVPAHLKRYGKNLAALAVEGDSMYPTLDRGDLVVCDSCGWSGEGIYALRMNGEGYVKRVTHDPGKILLISDNPKYPIREYQEDIEGLEIVGRIHCAIKNLE
jgi:phage repressor protein C with HTH and peptisase S24 domain